MVSALVHEVVVLGCVLGGLIFQKYVVVNANKTKQQ